MGSCRSIDRLNENFLTSEQNWIYYLSMHTQRIMEFDYFLLHCKNQRKIKIMFAIRIIEIHIMSLLRELQTFFPWQTHHYEHLTNMTIAAGTIEDHTKRISQLNILRMSMSPRARRAKYFQSEVIILYFSNQMYIAHCINH